MKQNTIVAITVAVLLMTGTVAALTNTVPTQGTVPVKDADAPVVFVTGGKTMQMGVFGADPNTTTVNTTAGNVAVTGDSDANVTVDQITGQFTNVSDVHTNDSEMTINSSDQHPATVNGTFDEFVYRNGTLNDGSVDFQYNSSSLSNITVETNGSSIGVGAINDSSGELMDNTVSDSDGTVSFENLPTGNHSVRLQKAPANLLIKNETSPNQLIDDADATIRFLAQGDSGSKDQVTRVANTGEVDMTGLAKNESFVVSVSAENYSDRQIYVQNLFEQQTVYLLNKTVPTVTKTFEYTDFSGSFPQEDTVLVFQRPLNDNFTTVSGDVIGATGEYRVSFEQGARHRILLQNVRTGEERIQGPFTPLVSGRQQIEIFSNNEISISALGPILNFTPSTAEIREDKIDIETEIVQRSQPVNSATVTTYRRTNGQLTQLAQNTTSGPTTVRQTVNLTGYNESTAVVEVNYTLDDGSTDTKYRNYSIRKLWNNQNSLLSALGGFSAQVSGSGQTAFESTVAILVSLLLAAAAASRARLSGASFGMVMLGGLAGFSVIGWVGYGLVFSAGTALFALIALRRVV